jgi:hypothetical protein
MKGMGRYFGIAIGRPTKPLEVTAEEKEKLTILTRRAKSAQAMVMRARIVLGRVEGLSNGAWPRSFRLPERQFVNGGNAVE